MSRIRSAAAALLLVASCIGNPAQAGWVASWTAAPAAPSPQMGPIPAAPSFNNQTLRQVVRLSAAGAALRVRFTNAYGRAALPIGGARVALIDAGGREIAGSSRALTFGGATTAVAAQGAPLLSDPVPMPTPPLARLAVSLYLPGETGPCSCHGLGLDDAEVSPPGDFTAKPFKPISVLTGRAFLAAVEVEAVDDAGTVVVLGDSISDGTGSTPKANRRWPDILAERLARRGGRSWGVANQGIGGNRLLANLMGAGDSALARFDRDVLAVPGVKVLIVFEGVNDLQLSFAHFEGPAAKAIEAMPDRKISAAQMIAGYRQIIDRAHQHGVTVYGATITPYKGAGWSPEGEAVRQEVNRFIRSGAFDAVLDFDKVLADPSDPLTMRADYTVGDHLHGNDAGYKALADSIDLNLFPR